MTVKRYAIAALGATLLLGAAAPASFAAPGRPGPDGPGRGGPERGMMQDVMFVRLLKNADANKDGKISKEEVAAWQETMFTGADANKDGTLTPGEMREFHETRMKEWRDNRRAERAGDDQGPDDADIAEGAAPPPPPGGPEGKPGHREMAGGERGPGRHHGDGPRHGMRDGMGPRGMMPGIAMVRMADTDENGQISRAEATEAVDKMFARMDRNKDGMITIDDLPDRPL
jgi:EF hand